MRLVLNALQSVESEHHGTLQSIDYAVPDLVREGYFDALSDLVAELIRNSQGKNWSRHIFELSEGTC